MQVSRSSIGCSLFFILLLVAAQTQAQAVVKLWPGVAPGSEHWTQKEVVVPKTPVGVVAINVVTPTLTAYLPPPNRRNGIGIVIAPGGYCVSLALSAEGSDVARWLQKRGIAAFVLKYRTQEKIQEGIPRNMDMDKACKFGIEDGVQAIKMVRMHARKWGVDPNRVGIIGFSAGGMVATGTMLAKDSAARPDFVALIYGAPFGAMPPIPAKLPPIFMAWAQDDEIARTPIVKFYKALVASGVKPEAHIYQAGGHGFGLKEQRTTSDKWAVEFIYWLEANGFEVRASVARRDPTR